MEIQGTRYRFENLYNYPVKRYFVMLVIILSGHLMFFWLFNVFPIFGRLGYKIFVAVGLFVLTIEFLMLYIIVTDRSVKEVMIDLSKGVMHLRYKYDLEIRSVELKYSDIESIKLEEDKNLSLKLITKKGVFNINTKYNQYTREEVLKISQLVDKLREGIKYK